MAWKAAMLPHSAVLRLLHKPHQIEVEFVTVHYAEDDGRKSANTHLNVSSTLANKPYFSLLFKLILDRHG